MEPSSSLQARRRAIIIESLVRSHAGKFWSFRGIAIGSWSAVEVENGSAEADGSCKRYFLRVALHMRTPREAVTWTYGLTEQQYADLELRT